MAKRKVIEKHYPENIRTEVFRTLMQYPIEGIPGILSLREADDEWIVTEEYIPGRTLASVLRDGLFKRSEAVKICLKLCDILEDLHSLGIVHGDIKPENIIITNRGKVYLIDFDASHFVKDEIGRDTVLMGTPGFASPEQFGFGRSDPRSDIYAIGVLINIMMTGEHPVYNMAEGRISIVVKKCTEVDPEKRYQSIKELRKGLKHPREAHEFYPVGFRSGNPGKMFLAGTVYAAWFALIILMGISAKGKNVEKSWVVLGWLTAVFLGTLGIFFNYGGINDIFSQKTGARLTAKLIEEAIFLLTVTILAAVIGRAII